MRQRPDIIFRLLTKRAARIKECLPKDWGNGYENVLLQVTTENQKRADERLSILQDIPARHKGFMAAPFIGEVDAEKYLKQTRQEYINEFFDSTNKNLTIFYRRKSANGFRQTKMEMIPAEDYTNDKKSMYLYVKDIDK